MKVEGQCHCGKISYEAEVDPDGASICHCNDCQTFSGSPFRASIPAPAATFLLKGEPRIYVKVADSGAQRAQAFCPDCGTPIYAAAPKDPPIYSLRLGAIKQRAQLRPSQQIWYDSALPWAFDLQSIEKHHRQG